jgi:hypothetical protein
MKNKINKWIAVKANIITEIHPSNTFQQNMTETPWNSEVKLGENTNWYDKNFKRIPDSELVKSGIRTDNRGTYYDKGNYKKTIEIIDYDILVPVNFTNTAPIENEPCIWENGKWIIDEDEKESGKRQARKDEIIKQLYALDQEYLTPRILAGIARGDDYAIRQAEKHEAFANPLREEWQSLDRIGKGKLNVGSDLGVCN